MKLDHISAGVLFLFWERSCLGEGSILVPAKTLHEELLKGLAGKIRPGLQIAAVKNALRLLQNAGIIEYGVSTKSRPVPGPAPNGYRLSVDPQIITWPASAAIAIFVHKRRRVSRAAVIDEIMRLRLTHHNTDKALERDDVSPLIDWCISHGYIVEKEMMVDHGTTQRMENQLTSTVKVDEHELYLEKLFTIKRRVATERPSSGDEEHDLLNLG